MPRCASAPTPRSSGCSGDPYYIRRVLLVSISCACGSCTRVARVTMGPDGVELSRRDTALWVLRSVPRGDARIGIRAWSRSCLAASRASTRRHRPITEPAGE